ncbi:beta-glucosidase [Pseudopedobacter beijingensis]|uniref:Glycoside hydrolase family 3 protein n=1 Tax=Pseudopedobacter beijingensis TaxID=1207056 RepID=A0ABW4IDT3_9SPHI
MKRVWNFLLISCFSSSVVAQVITPEVKKRADKILKQMTLEQKIDYIGGEKINYPGIRPMPEFGIPHIRMADGPQGIRKYDVTESTLYPCGMLSAATWNKQLVKKLGIGLGQDARSRGIHILLGPGVNIYRSPLCGRNFEYFGEDPYLSGETAVAYIQGVQSQGVIATIKHFAANNQEWDRHNVSSDIDERTLHEIYLRPFEKAIKQANVGAVMSAYNLLNGVHTSEHADLNINILRNKWNFQGILMSDWGSVYSSINAANGGLDLEMPRGRYMNKETLIPAIKNGIVSEETIDEKVRHLLEIFIAYGFLDKQQQDKSIPYNNPYSNQVALELAREGVVLLKNDNNILPLTKEDKVLILGPNANRTVTGGGSGFVHTFSTVDLVSGMKQLAGTKNIQFKDIVSKVDIKASSEFFTEKGSTTNGFNAQYYDNIVLGGKPLVAQTDLAVDFDWGNEAPMQNFPKDNFSVRWTSIYKPKNNALVKFKLAADNGFRMFINNKEVISDWHDKAYRSQETSFRAEAGKEYNIKIEYYEKAGAANIDLAYEKVNLDDVTFKQAVQSVNKIVLSVGFDSSNEKENKDRTFAIPTWQEELVKAVAEINKNVIVVVNSGGGVDFSSWGKNASAIMMAWYTGQQGGTALAEILTGKISPSGKLPLTIEKKWEENPTYKSYYAEDVKGIHLRVPYKEGIFVGYRGYDHFNIEPYYPFGYGLTYSSFEYKNFRIEKAGNLVYNVSFDITNTGEYDAAEVAQIYVGLSNSVVVTPPKELKGYEKVFLKKGETKKVTVPLDKDSFTSYDVKKHQFVINPGKAEIMIGKSSRDIVWKQAITL